MALPALAATLETGLEYAKGIGLGTQDLRITAAKIIRAILGFLGIVAVALIMYGGFRYMTSAGNPEKVQEARKVLINTAIGLLIILTAFAITQFILSYLLWATGAGRMPAGPPPYGGGGGALGAGIIADTYPARNAIDIPRNTNISVTFKEAMKVDSLINDNNTPDNLNDDTIIANSIKIRKTADLTGPYVAASASHTDDLLTFIFNPVPLLGTPDGTTNYTVELTNNIKKFDGSDAFGLYNSYTWSFEVSSITDLIPPQIVSASIYPRPTNISTATVPKNSVIQLTFNEAINPMTIRGLVKLENDAKVGQLRKDADGNVNTFNIINVMTAANSYIGGEFTYGNQYRTVDFVSNDLCAQNACGEDIFCLPGNALVSVLVKAATLEDTAKPTAIFPYDGIVDMADNSLDGNANGSASGPQSQSNKDPFNYNAPDEEDPGDDAKWSFFTNNQVDLEPPQIESYLPEANEEEVDLLLNFKIYFSKLLMLSTLKSNGTNQTDFISIIWPTAQELAAKNYPGGGWAYWINSDSINNKTVAIINHEILGEEIKIKLSVGSGIRDITQNCYNPCSGPNCARGAATTPGKYGQGIPWQGDFPSCAIPPPSPSPSPPPTP